MFIMTLTFTKLKYNVVRIDVFNVSLTQIQNNLIFKPIKWRVTMKIKLFHCIKVNVDDKQ